jgi:hypothetical protein
LAIDQNAKEAEMSEIVCPSCHTAFKVSEASYAEIVRQVRDSQFREELESRLAAADREKQAAIDLAVARLTSEHQASASARQAEIQSLQARLEAAEVARNLAVAEALAAVERERDSLANDLARANASREAEAQMAAQRHQAELQRVQADFQSQIQELRSTITLAEQSRELVIRDAVAAAQRERDEAKAVADRIQLERQLGEKALEERYQLQIRDREETIERLKDLKAKLSTKMLGETLESHCQIEFERVRPMGFPLAQFHKDNDASTGSKGDFVFRDFAQDGTEIVSIMFEMKNEADTTATKKTNDDFLKELDRDRREKGCEYAILVSLLEADNELYNMGIVDVSHRYPKMYVVRPQFFLPIITLLRNAALNAAQYKSELALVKAQNIDITSFEGKLGEFKKGFARNYELANTAFGDAIKHIDKTIIELSKTKDELIRSNNNFRLANDKLTDLSIKKLTRGNPTMTAMFADARGGQESED